MVFPAVSAAVLCGLAIVEAAGHRTSDDGEALPAIPVGIGIHAGETVDTPDGYVGTAVNIAARICAIARPGEVLVSDTVRALTQTVLPVVVRRARSAEAQGRDRPGRRVRRRRECRGVAEAAPSLVSDVDDRWPSGPF